MLKYCSTIPMVVLVFELTINFLNFGTKVHYGSFIKSEEEKI